MRTQLPNTFRLLWYFNTFFHQFRHELERVCGSSPRCYFNIFSHGLERELGVVLVWELHIRNSMPVLEHAAIPRGPVCLSTQSEARVGPNYFTISLQSIITVSVEFASVVYHGIFRFAFQLLDLLLCPAKNMAIPPSIPSTRVSDITFCATPLPNDEA